jgi:hypothetical protein
MIMNMNENVIRAPDDENPNSPKTWNFAVGDQCRRLRTWSGCGPGNDHRAILFRKASHNRERGSGWPCGDLEMRWTKLLERSSVNLTSSTCLRAGDVVIGLARSKRRSSLPKNGKDVVVVDLEKSRRKLFSTRRKGVVCATQERLKRKIFWLKSESDVANADPVKSMKRSCLLMIESAIAVHVGEI